MWIIADENERWTITVSPYAPKGQIVLTGERRVKRPEYSKHEHWSHYQWQPIHRGYCVSEDPLHIWQYLYSECGISLEPEVDPMMDSFIDQIRQKQHLYRQERVPVSNVEGVTHLIFGQRNDVSMLGKCENYNCPDAADARVVGENYYFEESRND